MSEKLQCFVLFLPTIGGQDAVDVLLDGIVFPHTFFQASVLSVQPILFFGQSGIFLAQLGKVGELVTDARCFQRPRRRFKENDFSLMSAQILLIILVDKPAQSLKASSCMLPLTSSGNVLFAEGEKLQESFDESKLIDYGSIEEFQMNH